MRELLPNRRQGETFKMNVKGFPSPLFVTVNRYPDNRVGEIFIDIGKEGEETRELMHGFAMLCSYALQIGGSPRDIIKLLESLKGPDQIGAIPSDIPAAVASVLKEIGAPEPPGLQVLPMPLGKDLVAYHNWRNRPMEVKEVEIEKAIAEAGE